ncbi:uncharacterized protein KY384_008213 [Bacidia gigantensis]|uniref:uncharacterized protein n=1 Tax=Bacidia gigantensis TaxID=2732470 RepID=UPI001D047F30|nr:uncharacterized protein KY384_008213 [Bacidia gigantensis]KAG8526784.1 hypothetical protein KY384_008213 [Bacidia gigantensis]
MLKPRNNSMLRTLPRQPICRLPLTSIRRAGTGTANWDGRQADEHITNRDDHLNVQSSASKSGQKDRSGGEGHSQATTQQDKGNQNEQAKKDHPEAPGPVIGMNDERGGLLAAV